MESERSGQSDIYFESRANGFLEALDMAERTRVKDGPKGWVSVTERIGLS